MDFYNKLSSQNQGLLLLTIGAVLLLNTLGVTWLNMLILIGSLYIIILGLIKLQVHKRVQALLKKNKQ